MMSSRPVTALIYASRHEIFERMAPHYREASCAQKTLLLDQIVAMTGYARKYTIQLLNHPPQGKGAIKRPRLPRYGSQVSVSTAERFLRTHHKPAFRGLSTTQAGPLLKQQIPIRTFHQWDDAQLGFLEADLVARSGK